MTPIITLATLLTLNAIHPCAAFRNTYTLLGSTPAGHIAVRGLYHSEAEVKNIDARLLVAVAFTSTLGGSIDCGVTNFDPFTASGRTCDNYTSFADAIHKYTEKMSHYIHVSGEGFDFISDIEHWSRPNVRDIFIELHGRPTVPLFYSSSCCGDCNHNQSVEINELIYAINLTLCAVNCPSISTCAFADADFSNTMDITDLIRDVLSALDPCPAH